MAPRSYATFALLLLPLVGCEDYLADDDDDLDPVPVETWDGGDITEDTRWEGTWVIETGIAIEAEWVLEPCTRIEIGPGAILNVQNGGSVVALGEPDCPVTFTSTMDAPAAGDWARFDIWSSSSAANAFEYVDFEWGGSDLYGAVWVESGATVSMKNIEVRNTVDNGLFFEPAADVTIEGATFENIGGHPAVLGIRSAGQLSDVTVGTSVQDPSVRVAAGTLDRDASFAALDIPYELEGQSIHATWGIEPGAVVQMASDTLVHIEDGGAIHADGTANDPVIFESANGMPLPGDWARFDIWSSADNSNRFTDAIIRHGGSDTTYGAMWVENDAAVTLDRVVFEENDGCDVWHGDNAVVQTDGTSFERCNP